MWESISCYEKFYFGKSPGQRNAMSDLSLFKSWAEGKGITRYTPAGSGGNWHQELQTGRRRYARYRDDPPYLDHGYFFKNPHYSMDGNPPRLKTWLAYQPYQRAEDIRAEVWDWAVGHGLRAAVYSADKSWYYPGATCLVVIDIPDL